jgi:hypothetical protein
MPRWVVQVDGGRCFGVARERERELQLGVTRWTEPLVKRDLKGVRAAAEFQAVY